MHLQKKYTNHLGIHWRSRIDWKAERAIIITGRIITWFLAYSGKFRKRESALSRKN